MAYLCCACKLSDVCLLLKSSVNEGWWLLCGDCRAYLELKRFCLLLCSCNCRVLSSFTGLGMKPTSHPSFTKRPIHQLLLYFCNTHTNTHTIIPFTTAPIRPTYMQEMFSTNKNKNSGIYVIFWKQMIK